MTESRGLQADKDQECEQMGEELRALESKLEANEMEHNRLQNEYELKLKELRDNKQELQHAQQ